MFKQNPPKPVYCGLPVPFFTVFSNLEITALTSCNIFFRTPDEDFSILLEAAVMYDRRVAAILNEDDSIADEFIWKEIYDEKQCLYPRLLFIITGKLLFTYRNTCSHLDFSKLATFFIKVKGLTNKSMKIRSVNYTLSVWHFVQCGCLQRITHYFSVVVTT